MTDLHTSITAAFVYLDGQGVEIPPDIWQKSIRSGVFKADTSDLSAINKAYNKSIIQSLIDYFEGGGIAPSRNAFKRATIQAFGDAFDAGFIAGGGALPIDEDAMDWLQARINQEFGFIEMLFQEARELRKEDGFDFFAWATERAGGYTRTLREIYNAGHLRAMDDVMVTFDGTDGAKPCATCKKLKGKRHKISWFVKRNYIPPHGSGLDCAKGGYCMHGLRKDNGEWVTI